MIEINGLMIILYSRPFRLRFWSYASVLGFGGSVSGIILAVGEHAGLRRSGVVDNGVYRVVVDETVLPEFGRDVVVETLLLLGCECAPEKIGVESAPVAAAVVCEELPEVVEG